ncbi:threonine/serine exporter ThrE family protein [Occultella aeris]|uniref:Threonine/serine exporter family protein n=1 Tax=Occultella aeris TaxID=2761496 RepID=A0A7M4DD84_9MICO|nr:threonine/serine exporter family protein [Occultella aeris]VZO34803.1 hypothetical protein HALOF300_00073 [Occultella aeris]
MADQTPGDDASPTPTGALGEPLTGQIPAAGPATGPVRKSARTPTVWSVPQRTLRARARRAMAGDGPPTVTFAMVRKESGLTAEVERSVLDLVLRTGEVMIATGAPVADTTAVMLRLAAAYGVTNCQVDITFISITASIDRDDDPVTKVRVINVRTSDYSRLTDVTQLVDEAGAGNLSLEAAHERMNVILTSPHPYRRSVVTVALGMMAAGVAVLLGGGLPVAAVAAATTMVIDRSLRFLRNRGLPYLFQQALGAGIATLVALLMLWGKPYLDISDQMLPPSLVVASGIVVLLAGLSLVGAAQDAISGFPLTAAARSYEVVLYTVGIVIGIGFVLDVGRRFGVPLSISDVTGVATALPLQIACGAVIAGAWSVASYTRMRTVPVVMGVGALASASYAVFLALGMGPAGSSFGAALVVGLLSALVQRSMRTPSMVIAVCGITPLLPGLAIYAAMFEFVDSGDVITGAVRLIAALSIGLALAAGVTLGEFIGTPLGRNADRWQRKVQARARGTRI